MTSPRPLNDIARQYRDCRKCVHRASNDGTCLTCEYDDFQGPGGETET
jgi:hypothetical protein